MTTQEMYRRCEKLYANVNWKSQESIHQYNEAVRELRRLRDEENEREAERAWKAAQLKGGKG